MNLTTTQRPACLQNYLDATKRLFQEAHISPAAHALVKSVFQQLETPATSEFSASFELAACSWLAVVLAPAPQLDSATGRTARAIQTLRPWIKWSRRTSGKNGSENYELGHANALICGPGGLEERKDVHVGFTIMAPAVCYPEHHHPGEEAYVLLSPGAFRSRGSKWFDPGLGRGLHNAPWDFHAMRSHAHPLLTLWILKL